MYIHTYIHKCKFCNILFAAEPVYTCTHNVIYQDYVMCTPCTERHSDPCIPLYTKYRLQALHIQYRTILACTCTCMHTHTTHTDICIYIVQYMLHGMMCNTARWGPPTDAPVWHVSSWVWWSLHSCAAEARPTGRGHSGKGWRCSRSGSEPTGRSGAGSAGSR